MAAKWCEFAKRNAAPTQYWGPEQNPDVGVLHSTESRDKFRPEDGSYFGHTYWPNATVNSQGVWEHIPINHASRALRNLPGGVQTNHEGTLQIEIDWNAKDIRNCPEATMEHLRKYMRWVEENSKIPRVCTVSFVPYPESYGDAPQRLGFSEWETYFGWLGHQHVPENLHGDPGDIDIDYLLDISPSKEIVDMDEPAMRRLLEEFFAKEGFGDIALNRRVGQLKAWQLPGNKTIYSAVIHEGKLAAQAHTDPKVVQFWQSIGVFPNPIPVLDEETAAKQSGIDVIIGS